LQFVVEKLTKRGRGLLLFDAPCIVSVVYSLELR